MNTARGEATRAIDTGIGDLRSGYTQASDLYGPLAQLAGQRSRAYDEATGVYGTEGLNRARETFTATPGYREGYDTGLNELDRRAAARGQLGSGNTSADTIKFATDYANQKYGDYISRLLPFVGQDVSVTGAQAAIPISLADKLYEAAVGKGGIGFQTAQGIGNAQADLALAPQQTSMNLLNTLLGIGNIAASAYGGKSGYPINSAYSGFNTTGLPGA